MNGQRALLDYALAGHLLADDDAMTLADFQNEQDLAALMEVAAALRDRGHGATFPIRARSLFRSPSCAAIPATIAPSPIRRAAMERGLSHAGTRCSRLRGRRAGADAARRLFTLGDKPELRYRAARAELDELGTPLRFDYLAAMAALVLQGNRPAAASQSPA